MKKAVVLVTVIVFIICYNTQACTCIGISNVKESYKECDVLLVGKVLDINRIDIPSPLYNIQHDTIIVNYSYFNKVTVSVTNFCKGRVKQDTIDIYTGVGGGDCGYMFKLGEQYFVYSNWRKRFVNNGENVKPFLYTNICSRTTAMVRKEVEEVLYYKKRRYIFWK